jgi:hypothetical protein
MKYNELTLNAQVLVDGNPSPVYTITIIGYEAGIAPDFEDTLVVLSYEDTYEGQTYQASIEVTAGRLSPAT